MGIQKLTTSAYHPTGNGGTEQVNRTMAQLLYVVVTERQNDLGGQMPHVEAAFNNSVNAATRLAPNEVQLGSLLGTATMYHRGVRVLHCRLYFASEITIIS